MESRGADRGDREAQVRQRWRWVGTGGWTIYYPGAFLRLRYPQHLLRLRVARTLPTFERN
jgi:hypothetical protein